MARLITEERRVLMGSLHVVLDIHRLFNLYKCDWMARDPGTYSEEIVRELYASYVATLRGSISKRSKPLAQDPLTSTLVRGCPVDISPATISRFLYGPTTGHSWSLNTAEFDYRWDIVRSGASRGTLSSERLLYYGWLVLERSAPAIDLSALQAELASLRTDVDAILAATSVEPQVAPTALADDTVLDVLFSGTAEEGLEPTHAKVKRHHSRRTEEEKAQKRQRRQEKEARRASILNEELFQQMGILFEVRALVTSSESWYLGDNETVYLKFEAKHGHYLAKRSKRSRKKEETKIYESPNPFGESPTYCIFAFCSSVLSPDEKDQVGGKRKQSAHRREVPRRSTMSPINSEHDDVEGWYKTAMNYTKGRITEMINDFD
uniref:Integrase core domain containing protein n=1 Tax=Solanum tuberosum TaxID=4113 RepID=M1E136_SOLTU